MNLTKKQRSVLLTVMTLVLCLALVAGGTYALFSDQVTLGNHLVAGTLDITLIRTNLTTTSLNRETGFLVETEKSKDIDFSKPWDPAKPELENENIFDITEGVLIVPGSKYSAEMLIANSKEGYEEYESSVAFGYWIEIKLGTAGNTALAEQINITVTTVDATKKIDAKALSESGGMIGSDTDPIGVLALGGENLFTVTIEFVDDVIDSDIVNNDVMGATFDFDLIVHAVQITTAP